VPHGTKLSASLRASGADALLTSRARIEAELAVTLAGRAAERLVLGECSSHGADDVARASRVARSLVTRLGMNEMLGPQALADEQGMFARSASLANRVDDQVAWLVEAASARAQALLNEQRAALDALTTALLAQQTLSAEQYEPIIAA